VFSLLGLKDYLYIGAIVAMGGLLIVAWFKLSSVESERDKLQVRVAGYESVAEAGQKEAEVKVVEVVKEVEVVKWKTETKIQKVKEYVYDGNKSECDNAVDFLRRNL